MTSTEPKPAACNRSESCEQLIERAMQGRFAELIPDIYTWDEQACLQYLRDQGHEVPANRELDDLCEEVIEVMKDRNREDLLGLEIIRTYKLCLSWGGPADYFELHWSEQDRDWTGGRYHYHNWFDSAQRSISAEQAEQIADAFDINPQYD